uniref:WD40 repeat domain-containing protein n=1 Tax=Roseivirga sp. TaxID=1964215 RepID=UPI004048D77B
MAQVNVKKLSTVGGHQDCVYTLAKGPNPNQFFSAGADGVVALWDLDDMDNGRIVAKVPSSVYAICYYPERNALIIGQNFEGLHIIDFEKKEELASIKLAPSQIFDIKVIKDRIIVAQGNGEVYVLDIRTLEKVHIIRDSEKSARTLSISEKNAHLAVGYSDNKIRIYSLKDWRLVKEIDAHKISVFTVRYSPDERFLLSGSRDAHIKVWDVIDGYTLKESIVAHMYAINHLEFSPDNKHFVTCSMDKSIKVWDAVTYQLLKVIDKARHAGHGTSINKLLWSEHNNLLISASDDRSISIWDINF